MTTLVEGTLVIDTDDSTFAANIPPGEELPPGTYNLIIGEDEVIPLEITAPEPPPPPPPTPGGGGGERRRRPRQNNEGVGFLKLLLYIFGPIVAIAIILKLFYKK